MSKANDPSTVLLQRYSPETIEAWARAELARSGPLPLAEFIQTNLREHLWSKQIEICDALDKHRRVAVPSCHGSGKSFNAARIAVGWLNRYDPGDAFVLSSAPSDAQVKAILWREVNRCYKRSKKMLHPDSRVNLKEYYIGNELVGFGRKPQDQDPAAFQGIHQRFLLVIFDEACGMPKELWDAANTLTTNENARFLAIGNPDDPTSYFAEVCKPGSGWHVIQIPAKVTPNFTGEKVPDRVREVLVTPMWEKERAEEWGKDSPLYVSKVLAEFPSDAEDGVVPWSKVAKCRLEKPLTKKELMPVHLGVDVGAGGDQTVIRERRGMRAGRVWRNRSRDSEVVVGLVVRAIQETGATKVRMDSQGIGWGVVGHVREKLRELGLGHVRVIKVNVAVQSTKPNRFPKLRDQLWWEIGRELSVQGVWDLSAVDDTTISQLIAPKYEIDSAGRVKVEPKDETKKRIKRSPDDADALILAFYDGRGAAANWIEAWEMLAEANAQAEARKEKSAAA